MKNMLKNIPKDDFFQAINLLNRWLDDKEQSLCFKSANGLGFPCHAISHMKLSADNKLTIFLNFLGFAGQAGILPEHDTELLLTRLDAKDFSMADFLDIFINRIAQLLYSTWQRHRFYSAKSGEAHQLNRLLLALVGHSEEKVALQPLWIFYSGYLLPQARSKEGLEKILGGFLNSSVNVNEFSGQWFKLSQEQCSRLSINQAHNRLGAGAILGRRAWSVQHHCDIVIGPISARCFEQLLPDKDLLNEVMHIIRHYCGRDMQYTLFVSLAAEALKPCQLSTHRLGWDSLLAGAKTFQSRQLPISPTLSSIYLYGKGMKYNERVKSSHRTSRSTAP